MAQRWTPVIVFLLSLALLTINLNFQLNSYDEGLMGVGAVRVLEGELPYRDFYAFYPPGQFYLLASVYQLLGVSIIAGRMADVVIMGALMVVVFLLVRLLAGEVMAWVGWVLALCWRVWPPIPISLHPAMLLSMASLLCVILFLQRGGRWLLPAGLLVGLAALFRHDLAGYTAVAVLIVLPFYLWRQGLGQRRLMEFLGGVAVVLLPVAAYFVVKVPWEELVFAFYTIPFKLYLGAASAGFPTPMNTPYELESWWALLAPRQAWAVFRYLWAFYFPLLVCLAGLVWLVANWRGGQAGEHIPRWSVALLLLTALFHFNYLRSHIDFWHMWPFAIVISALFGVVVGRVWAYQGKRRVVRGAALALAGLALVPLVGPQAADWLAWLRYARSVSPEAEFAIPRARGIIMEPGDRGMQAAVAWILENVPPQESIFVAHYRNDLVLGTNMMVYFLAQRPIPTRFHAMDQGITTTPESQRGIIRELEEHGTRYVVLDYSPTMPIGAVPGSRVLDEYLAEHFRSERIFPCPEAWWKALEILVRKDTVSSGAAP